jgi:hypothetical protein
MATIIEDSSRVAAALITATADEGDDSIVDAWSNLSSSLSSYKDSFSFDTLSQISSATGSAAVELINAKLEAIFEAMFAPHTVTLKSLLDMTGSAFAQTPVEMASTIVDKLDGVLSNITSSLSTTFSSWSSLRSAAASIGSEITTDTDFVSSMAAIEGVQSVITTVSSVLQMYTAVVNLATKLEPAFPYVEIIVDAALTFWSGGTSGVKMGSEAAQLAGQELKKLFPLILQPLKQMIYDVELTVPAIVLGGLDFLSSEASASSWNSTLSAIETDLQVSDAQYAAVVAGLSYSTMFDTAVDYLPANTERVSAYLNGLVAETTEGRELLLTSTAQTNTTAIDSTDSSSYESLIEFSNSDIISISYSLVEAQDTTMDFYTDRQMFKLVVEQLIYDGCIADIDARSYDEAATLRYPIGDRHMFNTINDRVTLYHRLLKTLIGEVRADITETIPVIDFYQKSNTSLLSKYAVSSSGGGLDFTSTVPVTRYAATDAAAPSASILIETGVEQSIINLAVSRYEIAQHFYGTSARLSEEFNIQVAHEGTTTPQASALLNGLFTVPASYSQTDGAQVETWSWGTADQEAYAAEVLSEYGVALSDGVRYCNSHLVTDGEVISNPLATTEHSLGLASLYFEDVTSVLQEQLLDKYTADSNTSWKAAGGVLAMATALYHSQVEYVTETYTTTGIKWVKLSSGWFSWVWYPQITDTTRTREVAKSAARYPDKISYLCGSPDRFDAEYWTDKIQDVSGTEWLVLDADSDSKIAVVKRHVNHQGETTTTTSGASYTTGAGVYFQATINDSGLTKLSYITPLDLFYNSTTKTEDDGDPTTALLLPDQLQAVLGSAANDVSSDGYFPEKLFLASKTDLGFDTADSWRSLCTFTDGDNSIAFRVTKVTYVDIPAVNVKLIYKGVTYTKTGSSITVDASGSSCYVYELTPLKLDYAADELDLYPVKYPATFFQELDKDLQRDLSSIVGISSYYTNPPLALSNLRDSVALLPGMAIVVGLPIAVDSTYSSFAITKSPECSVALYDKLGIRAAGPVVSSLLGKLPVISSTSPVRLRELPSIISNLIAAKDLLTTLSSNGLDGLDNFIARIDYYKQSALLPLLLAVFSDSGENLTAASCAALDALLGNDATPWISIGDESTDDVSLAVLNSIADYAIEQLEGSEDSGSYPVQYVSGDSAVSGRTGSLYYQRYLFLNNRLHRTEGHLAKAASLLDNWRLMRESRSQNSSRLDSYAAYIAATPVESTSSLVYYPADEDKGYEEVFYNQTVLDYVSSNIDDKCLLICGPCPVRATCKYFDEEGILRKYMPTVTYYDMWFKDNQLDLLVYDEEGMLDMYQENSDGEAVGEQLNGQRIRNRHLPYTEILHDEGEEMLLSEVRSEIASHFGGYRDPDTGRIADELNWLQGGRYGSLTFRKSATGGINTDPDTVGYLYDALFIADTESEFGYTSSATKYPVSLTLAADTLSSSEVVTYSGEVSILIPSSLKLLSDVPETSDVYLVSDDTTDADGNAITPLIYLNQVRYLGYKFDLQEDGSTDSTAASDDAVVTAADVAQWSVNEYKTFDSTADQYWMSKVRKITSDNTILTVSGRSRVTTVVDPLTTSAPSTNDLLRGKPMVNSYINFIRKMSFDMRTWQWVKGTTTAAELEAAKATLPCMVTNVRLVVVKH